MGETLARTGCSLLRKNSTDVASTRIDENTGSRGYTMNKPLTAISLILLTLTIHSAFAYAENEEVMAALFNQLDVNGNGYLSKDEIQTKTNVTRWLSVSSYGGFEIADVNGDGQLEKREFAAFEEDLPVE